MSDSLPEPLTPAALQATKFARRARLVAFAGLALVMISLLSVMVEMAVSYSHKPHVLLGAVLLVGVLVALGGGALAVVAIREPGRLTRRGYVHIYLAWLTLGATILIVALGWWTLPYYLGTGR